MIAFGRGLIMRACEGEPGYFEFDCSAKEWDSIWAAYFDLDTDYAAIEELIKKSGDAHLLEAFESGRGIRILRQDLWEVIISFLISQNNNISRIKGSVEALCREGGVRAKGEGKEFSFPGPKDIDPSMFEAINLGLGYRVPYLK